MIFIDLSERIFDENGHAIPFESAELEKIFGPDPLDKIKGLLIPGKNENHQTLIVTDDNDYSMKVYKRQRLDKDHAWEYFRFAGFIEQEHWRKQYG